MATVMESFQEKLVMILNQKGVVDDTFKKLETKTGVKRLYIAYALIGIVVFWLMFGWGAPLVCNLAGFLYPAYCSIKALESRNMDDDTQWLTYWVVFALFSVLEFFSDILVGWIPFYWLCKCVFLVWCMAPLANNGSAVIYHRVVRPLFNKHHTTIDTMVNKATKGATDMLDKAVEKAKDVAAEHQLGKKDE